MKENSLHFIPFFLYNLNFLKTKSTMTEIQIPEYFKLFYGGGAEIFVDVRTDFPPDSSVRQTLEIESDSQII